MQSVDETQGVWDRLAAVNLTMHRRIVEYLNAAIGAVNLAANSDPAAQLMWREQSIRQIMRAHNTFTAWSSLIRFKAGEAPTLPADQRVFRFGDLLDWLSVELTQKRAPHIHDDLHLRGSRETLQEAMILLYSCAYGLGPGVKLIAQGSVRGATLGVRYRKHGETPLNLDSLLNRPTENWRLEHLTFELTCVRDFLAMNGCELHYEIEAKHCLLTFTIPTARTRTWTRRLKPHKRPGEPADGTETILNEDGLRQSLNNDDDDDDSDATRDSDTLVFG